MITFENQAEILNKIVNNVEKVIIGKKNVIELMLCSFLCNGHVLIEDVPGVGKTSLASSLAKSFDCSFRRVQFTPDILPSDITGFSMFNQKTGEFEYREGAIMTNIVLADEINRTTPKTQSSLLEVMEENQVTVDGKTYLVPKPFIVLATQNPVEYLGTYPLPEAQLDRFFMKIFIGYPDFKDECKMLEKFNEKSSNEIIKPVATVGDLLTMQKNVSKIYVDKKVSDYIVEIITKTRKNESVILGASPRASLNLYKASQAWALYNQRDYVQPDDIIKMAFPVLEHRIFLKQDAILKKITSKMVVKSVIESVKIPF